MDGDQLRTFPNPGQPRSLYMDDSRDSSIALGVEWMDQERDELIQQIEIYRQMLKRANQSER